MYLLPGLIIGLSVGSLTYWVFSLRLPDADELGSRRRSLPWTVRVGLAYARWMGRGVLGILQSVLPGVSKKLEQSADRLALHADRPGAVSGIEVIGYSALSPIIVAAFLLMYASIVAPHLVLPILLVGTLIGAMLPVLYLRDVRNRRIRRLRASFPLALDLLNLCVEAGMDFTEGMKLLANRCTGLPAAAAKKRPDYPVCKLFAELLKDIQLGIPRTQALRRLELKTGLPEIRSFATTLSLADETGGSVAENLRRLAAEMRNSRVMRAEERIAKAPVKMAFPMALLLIPVLIIILGPIGLSLMDSLGAVQ